MDADDRLRRLLAAAAALPQDVDPATGAVMRRVRRRQRQRRALAVVPPVVVAAAVSASLLVSTSTDRPGDELRLAAALTPYTACDELTESLAETHLQGYERSLGRGTDAAIGSGGTGGVAPPVPLAPGAAPAAEGAAGAVTGSGATGGGTTSGATGEQLSAGAGAATDKVVESSRQRSSGKVSGTNNQEAGVDEPDLVKTDGERLVTVARGRLNVIELADGPRVTGSVALPRVSPAELLLVGDRALVLLRTGFPQGLTERSPGVVPQGRGTTVLVVDLAEPRIERSFDFEGELVASRLVGETARLVMSSGPPLVPYTAAPAVRDDRIRELTADDWLPAYRVRNGTDTITGRLVDCDRVSHPVEPTGAALLTVVSVDPDADRPGEAVTVAGAGETVYANETSLYVGTQRSVAPAAPGAVQPTDWVLTDLHRFDISDPARARYTGSGEVPGRLLNQYSMSELDGRLRVATTAERSTGTESFVSVLEQRGDGALDVVGQVGGLGKGERIHGVRFVGELGYVVTFRQIDPLYVIDLSQPANPRRRGELKIPGYSAYLHPIGDDLLLGVGQDGDAFGGRTGLQVSVFDVADPDAPAQLHKLALLGGESGAEFDPHAFLYWPDTATTVLPVQVPDGGIPFLGAVGYRVGRGGIEQIARISHQHRDGPGSAHTPIVRSMVIDDELFTFSDRGVLVSDLETLRDRTWLPYD